MTEWSLGDSLGILIVLAVTFGVASTLEGLAQALVALVGVLIVVLWIGTFVLEGYSQARLSNGPDR